MTEMPNVYRLRFAALAASGIAASMLPAHAKKHVAVAHPMLTANPVAWSALEGRNKVKAGAEDGIYLWHTGGIVHLVTTSTHKQGVIYAGAVVVTGGTIVNAKSAHDEREDHWRLASPSELDFQFDTHLAKDGVTFRLNGGTKLVIQAAERGTSTGALYVGAQEMAVPRLPLVVDLTR